MLLNAIPGVCRTSKKLTKPIYARTLAYIKAKLKLRWSPEQISLRIDTLLADQTLKDDDGWTGDMGLRPVSHMAICRYIYSLNGNERNERQERQLVRPADAVNYLRIPLNYHTAIPIEASILFMAGRQV